jgi:hypothetical protein
MKRIMTLIVGAALALAPVTASAARVVVVGRGPFIGPGFYGSYFGPYGYWGPGYPGYYGYYDNSGQIKIDTKSKEDDVFINGAFAGSTRDSKSFRLRPGTYTVEVRHAGQPELTEKVFVAAGKTLHLHPAI